MPRTTGRNLPLTPARRIIGDLMHFAQKVPTVPVQRRMRLGAVVAARLAAPPRPSWCAIFTKAYAIVCAARPELRRAYLAFPRPHLYEHAYPIASIAIERQRQGEDIVLFAPVRQPEERSLVDLDAKLRMFKEQPVEEIGSFRRTLRLARWPRLCRRLSWWVGLNVWGAKRAHYLGTFGVSVYAGLGAASLHPLSPITTALNYGVIEADGSVDVRLIYDHRVLDGATVARALRDLEEVLTGEMVSEMQCSGREVA